MVHSSVLRLIREEQKKSRRMCALAIGVDESTWKRWELGMLTPSSRSLLDIAAYLGVRPEELRELTGPRKERAPRRLGPGALSNSLTGGSLDGQVH